jgi:TolA-binding protein
MDKLQTLRDQLTAMSKLIREMDDAITDLQMEADISTYDDERERAKA